MDQTSSSLLDQLQGPDRAAAWGRFVRLYTPLLAHWAARAGVRQADRPDLIQDVFLTLLRALPSFSYDRGRSFRAWLHAVFVNKWKDACRKKAPVTLAADGSSFPAPPVSDHAPAIDEAEYRAVLVARAARLIESDFNPLTWQAFWKTTIEERAVAEVAAELGLSANAIYLARSRVLARLRQELAGLLE
ncbi:sigma-70 family RNA polymerase sigma factor [Fimbriiglobus ruber]|uniref:Transcriptional control n=1 Tax=Fimbriiglobus ruber TaxID=1908690 RepID=A0A225E4G1_9BACT|nr:sigma-70 family RNA polymerase sigma factor [Fimbriiglobus ruber]OWK45688.1 transcriptional control [Fimbriiglobus ruber]